MEWLQNITSAYALLLPGAKWVIMFTYLEAESVIRETSSFPMSRSYRTGTGKTSENRKRPLSLDTINWVSSLLRMRAFQNWTSVIMESTHFATKFNADRLKSNTKKSTSRLTFIISNYHQTCFPNYRMSIVESSIAQVSMNKITLWLVSV